MNAVKYSTVDNPLIILKGRRLKNGYFKFILSNSGYTNVSLPGLIEKLHEEKSDNNWAGLGLMICNKVVSTYNGKIKLRSSKKTGQTVVEFTLPLFKAKAT